MPTGTPKLTTKQLAAAEDVAARTVERWRIRGTGPKFTKVGKVIRYDPADVEQWRLSNTFAHQAEASVNQTKQRLHQTAGRARAAVGSGRKQDTKASQIKPA